MFLNTHVEEIKILP